MFARLGLAQKMLACFLGVVCLLGGTIAFVLFELNSMGHMQDVGAQRMAQYRTMTAVMEALDEGYCSMADSVILRQVEAGKKALADLEGEAAKQSGILRDLADTAEEKAAIDAYLTNLKAFIDIFKNEALPLLQAKAGDAALDEATQTSLRAIYGRIADKQEQANSTLVKVEQSVAREMEETDALFDAKRPRLLMMGTVAGVLAAILSLVMGVLLSRSIGRPIDQAVRDLASGADQIVAAAGQVNSSSQSLAEGASSQASSIEETSASLEELTSMTRQNADNSHQADGLMRQSLATIGDTNTAMAEMGQSMSQIATSSEQTSKIIKTIDEIAFQTNLLALNAAVEAARAGEAGAGFAVVADEVRNLAMRATEAAKNTASLIEDTVDKVKSGSAIVERVQVAFQEVEQSSSKVASLVSEITIASKEQAQGITQINQAITQMDSITQQNAASSEESAAAAEELHGQAMSLMDTVATLRQLVSGNGPGAMLAPTVAPASSGPLRRPPSLSAPAAGKRTTATPPAIAKSKPALAAPKKAAPPPKVAAAPPKKGKDADPEVIIPMGNDDTFEDF